MGWTDERGNVLRSQSPGQDAEPRQDHESKSQGNYFYVSRWREEIESLMEEISSMILVADVGNGSGKSLPTGGGSLLTVMREIDIAFEERSADRLRQACDRVRRLYHTCVSAWKAVLDERA